MDKRNQHVMEHQTQIRQSDNLKMTNTRTYMKPTTEISLHGNNTIIIQTRTIPKTPKQTHNKNQTHQHKNLWK